MSLVRLKKEGASFSTIIPGVTEFLPDGSFKTRAILGYKNSFGREMSEGIYRWYYENPHDKIISIVKPEVPYEVFEETDKVDNCTLLVTPYYMGNDYKDVVKYLGGEKFVIEEKIPVEVRIPNTEEYVKGRYNSILKYTGLDHLPKPKDKIKYEGDAYSLIELDVDCRRTMYKLIKKVNP